MRRGCKSLCIAVVLATLSHVADAQAGSRSASSGAVRATASWRDRAERTPDRLHVRIVRGGVTLVDTPVTFAGAPEGFETTPGYKTPVVVSDFDRDGEPEIVVNAWIGNTCCAWTKLWYWEDGGYRTIERNWGSQILRAGATLLVTKDDWSCVFSSCVGGVASPIAVFDARLRDVTADHPRMVERDLRRWRREYARYGSRAVLAVIIADMHSLGCHAAADAVLARARRQGVLRSRRAGDEPAGEKYERVLEAMLTEGSYRSRNKDRAVSTICGS